MTALDDVPGWVDGPISREQAIKIVLSRLNCEIYPEEIPVEALALLIGAVERPGQCPQWVVEEPRP